MRCINKKSAWFMSCGSVLVVGGAVLAVFWPSLFLWQLRRMMVLAPGSTTFGIWREIPIPMYLEFFMFNITNVDDILAGKNVKLKVEQLGPYVYREDNKKVNITFNENGTVTFYNERTYHYEPEMSNGSIDDNITTINPIIATVGYFMRHQHPIFKLPVDVFMRLFHDNLFRTATVSQWLFDGIEDPIIDVASYFPDLPINIPFDRFGWFYTMMVLAPGSTTFGIWREIPIPMYLEFFMFNITNVDDILAGKNVKLKVEQLGPYVYREDNKKVNITFNENGTVTFYNERTYHYEPEMSNGSIDDNITTINPIIATVGYFMRHQHPIFKLPVDVFMRLFHDNLFRTATVSQWLFDGIEDPIIDVASYFPDLPINIPFDRFGWFYTRNGSKDYDGVFLMNTGAKDFSSLGNTEKWRNSDRTWYRDECGKVQGSAGELWAPEIGQPEVTIFAPDVCTYMNLARSGSVNVLGVEGDKFVANNSLFDNGHNYSSKACYCAEVRDDDCLPSGALNVSLCRFGAPAFVTQPHFLQMDPYYAAKIDGLNATDEMNFHLGLEMITGMPLSVSVQLQINLLLRHVSAITINNQLPDADTLVPMFWFRQEIVISEYYARLARLALSIRTGLPYGFYALTAIGVLLLIFGIYFLVKKLRSPENVSILDSAHEVQ